MIELGCGFLALQQKTERCSNMAGRAVENPGNPFSICAY
jgi:hypothetical protein